MKALKQNVDSSVPSVPVARLVGHDGPIQAVRFTADGKYCLTAGHDRTVRLWNPSRMDPAHPSAPPNNPNNNNRATSVPVTQLPRALPIQTYQHSHPVSALAVHADATTMVAGTDDKSVVVTDMVTQQVKRRYFGHTGRINDVDIMAGGNVYASASYDGTVRLWDGRSNNTRNPIQILTDAKDSVTAVVAQCGGGNNSCSSSSLEEDVMIRTASVDGVVRTYHVGRGILHSDDVQNSSITGMALTRDGQCLAVSCLDGILRLMEVSSGELLNTYGDDSSSHNHHHNNRHVAGNYALECAVTADDRCVVTGSEDGRAVLYDLVRGTVVQSLEGHDRPTCSVATHPQRSSVMVTASYDGNAIVWANTTEMESYMSYE